jgi:hypothetical protein
MALTNRMTIAITGNFDRPPRSFIHASATGKPLAPHEPHPFTADAASNLLTSAAHGLEADEPVRFTSITTLPAGLVAGTTYYVIASGLTADAFKVSATVGGSEVDITDAGTGTHSWQRYLAPAEQAEFDIYLAYVTNGSGPPPEPATLPGAIAIIDLQTAYYQSPAYQTWWHDDQESREAQYRLRKADMYDANDLTVPPSGSTTGSGSAPPVSPVTRDPD